MRPCGPAGGWTTRDHRRCNLPISDSSRCGRRSPSRWDPRCAPSRPASSDPWTGRAWRCRRGRAGRLLRTGSWWSVPGGPVSLVLGSNVARMSLLCVRVTVGIGLGRFRRTLRERRRVDRPHRLDAVLLAVGHPDAIALHGPLRLIRLVGQEFEFARPVGFHAIDLLAAGLHRQPDHVAAQNARVAGLSSPGRGTGVAWTTLFPSRRRS